METELQRIFIVGCPRSGTTLTHSILAAHSEVFTTPESHFFYGGFYPLWPFPEKRSLRQKFAAFLREINIEDPRGKLLLDELCALRGSQSKAQWFFHFLDTLCLTSQKRRWVEKTADHVFYISLIEKALPEARFVHVIRKPAPTIESMYTAHRIWGRPHMWLLFFVYWRAAIFFSKRRCGQEGHYHLFYEDLIQNPQQETEKLLAWLGLNAEEGLLEKRKKIAPSISSQDEKVWGIKENVEKEIGPVDERIHDTMPAWLKTCLGFSRAYESLHTKVQDSPSA